VIVVVWTGSAFEAAGFTPRGDTARATRVDRGLEGATKPLPLGVRTGLGGAGSRRAVSGVRQRSCRGGLPPVRGFGGGAPEQRARPPRPRSS
jgi:hypothetical protein